MKTLREAIARRYPLTALGTVVLITLGAAFVRAFRTASAYDLAVALIGFAALAMLTVLVGAQLRRFELLERGLALHGRPVAGRHGVPVIVTGITGRTALFTRVHAVTNAVLEQQPGVLMRLRREAATSGGSPVTVRVPTPLSGRIRLHVRTELRDVFSLVRAPFGRPLERAELVLPGRPVGAREYEVQSYAGAEEHQRHKTADEQRYYMREYTPGDRFRDINWKASSRLSVLLTRVSPHSEKPTTVIQVEIRHYRDSHSPPSLESVLHLEMLRAWVLWFLRSVSANDSSVRFRIHTAEQVLEAGNDEELGHIAEQLATLPYVSPAAAPNRPERSEGEWFVFSTPFDTGLSARQRGRRPGQVRNPRRGWWSHPLRAKSGCPEVPFFIWFSV